MSGAFYNYPPPVEAAETPYKNPPASNPNLSGTALSVLSSIVANVGPLQSLLWSNAGFSQTLSELESAGVLDAHPPRYDPTVVPLASNETAAPTELKPVPSETSRTFHSSADYIEAYLSGATTPTAVAERILDSLAQDNRHLIFISPTPRHALLADAAASTARYAAGRPLPLDGVPLVVKDELDVAGTPKTFGMSSTEAALRRIGEAEKGQTSWCVQKLLDAGMLFLGKSNMHEIGLDTTNNNPNWGTPVNPYNKRYYPGGSSGGSGAAVGGGLCPIAVGADGGGSIRLPSVYCGVYGLKPSHGRVSAAPSPSLAPSVGVLGPIAATMADLELSYRLMATPAPDSPFPHPHPTSTPSRRLLGIYPDWFNDCSPEVLSATTAAINRLKSVGYETVNITLPYLSANRSAHALTILAEIAGYCRNNPRGLIPANKILISVGSQAPARDFLLAQKARAMMMSHLAHLFTKHPGMIIVTPTVPHVGVEVAPGTAEKGGAGVSDANRSLKSMQYVFLANWTGCPAISLPVGYSAENKMPMGLMGMAEWGAEEELIQWGKEWEGMWDGRQDVERKRGDGWVDALSESVAV